MKIKQKILQNRPFLVGLLVTVSLLWPLFVSPYFSHQDDLQVIRIYEMHQCFKDYQIPCRWVPDLGGGYGYPVFNYYGPLAYYIAELFYLLTTSLFFSAKMIFGLSFVGSYIFMYLLGKKLWGDLGGSLTAIFYAIAPYHALDFYVRGAMGEMWALMFFPAIFWAILKLKEKASLNNSLLLALFLACLIISHNLSAMIFFPLVLIFILIVFFYNRNFNFLKFSVIAFIFGLGLAAFYFIPVILEKNLVHVDTTTYGYFGYTEHFKGLRRLFLDWSWSYGSSIREIPGGPKDGMSFQIGFIHVILWILSLFSLKFFFKKNKILAIYLVFFSSAILASAFLVNPKSDFIWKMIDPLKYLQFPWRFLMIIIFFISLCAGGLIFYLQETLGEVKENCMKYVWAIWILATIAVLIANFSHFRPEKSVSLSEKEFLSGENWDKQLKRSIFDYLPIYAKAPPAENSTSPYQIITGDAKITNFNKGSNWINFQAEGKNLTWIRLSQYYFPDWRIWIDGVKININYENELGLMTFAIDPGSHAVHAKLFDTPVRIIGNLITLLSVLAILVLTLVQLKKIRRWFFYMVRGLNQ